MRNTYNNNAEDKENKVTAGPEWVEKETIQMWERIDETAKRTRVSINNLGKKYNFSPSTVYNTITRIKKGLPPRDTELRVIEVLANEMNVPLNYLMHGDGDGEGKDRDEPRLDNSLVENIFSLGNGNRLTLFLMAIPYLTVEELDAVREDMVTRFK